MRLTLCQAPQSVRQGQTTTPGTSFCPLIAITANNAGNPEDAEERTYTIYSPSRLREETYARRVISEKT